MRAPRKKKKGIPEGPYCYEFLELLPDQFGFKVRYCPFNTTRLDEDGDPIEWCNLKPVGELLDSCKSCGIKRGFKRKNFLK
jgi:hypothetical protein